MYLAFEPSIQPVVMLLQVGSVVWALCCQSALLGTSVEVLEPVRVSPDWVIVTAGGL